MKISQSQLNKSRDRKRMIRSFAIAFFVYVPIISLIFWQTPSLNFAAAGQNSTFSITLSQMTGGAIASSAELIEQKSTNEETQKMIPEKAVRTKNSRTQPTEKQQPPKEKTSKASTVQPNAVDDRQVPGGQTAGNQGGISTLIYGQINDAFLSAVKSTVEKSLVYPRRARSKGIEGVVTLQFSISVAGQLEELTVYRSSGNGILDNAAIRAVKKAQSSWPRPTRSVRLRFPIEFRIAD